MPKKDIPNRRPCVTTDVGEGLAVTVSFHPYMTQKDFFAAIVFLCIKIMILWLK